MFCLKSVFTALRINSLHLYTCSVNPRNVSTAQTGIIVEKLGFVTTLGINRPESKNELDQPTYEELCNCLVNFENDSNASSALLFGIGGNFCTGGPPDVRLDCQKLISSCKKPIVASLTGYATGFGFELALLCDLRVMETTAQIGLNGYPMQLSDDFYKRLVGVVGVSLAMDLTLTGRNINAKEAFQFGLVNRMVECGSGIGQGVTLAKWIGKYPADELCAIKNSVLQAFK